MTGTGCESNKATHKEFADFLQILWWLGASNLDARTLTVKNISWEGNDNAPNGHIVSSVNWTGQMVNTVCAKQSTSHQQCT